ncbi:hypothetical protein ABEB36_012880 [Hypothenemus hampei]|uniref:Uncharacterized protein n=1 Tax=Hypothenemus hampei TaxID=57062 RepID=A0ABD1E6D2_HYPHA
MAPKHSPTIAWGVGPVCPPLFPAWLIIISSCFACVFPMAWVVEDLEFLNNWTGVEDTDRITGYRPDGSVNPRRCITLILNLGQRNNCLNHHHQDNCKYIGDNNTKEVKENQLVLGPAPKRLS